MNDTKHPEMHVNEEPRNDMMDTGMGLIVTITVFFLIAIGATVITIFQ
jgi:heme/copper-type cytochrome/quinol oxidase subunit 2